MKKASRIAAIVIVAAFAITAIFFSFERNQKLAVSWFDSINSKDKEFLEESYFMGDDITYYNGRYIRWDGEKLTYLDNRGETLWSRAFLFEEPSMRISGGIIVIFGKNGELFAYGIDGKTRFELELEQNIFNVEILKKNILVHIKSNDMEKLVVFDLKGDEVASIGPTKNSFIGFWTDKKGIINYSDLRFKGNSMYSGIYTIKDSEAVVELKDEIIIRAISYRNSLLILTDEGIKLFSKKGIEWEKKFPLFKDAIVDGNDIYVLYGDNIELLSESGDTLVKETSSMDLKRLHKHGRYIIIYGKRDIIALRDGMITAEYSTGGKIKDIDHMFNDLIVTMEDGVSVMRLKDIDEN
ncbi:MAG: DUF5711 family protein [Gudongella sp.]|jgi:hypothetical protein|nr:DUF5711 family protein [Gudongella sp.]